MEEVGAPVDGDGTGGRGRQESGEIIQSSGTGCATLWII